MARALKIGLGLLLLALAAVLLDQQLRVEEALEGIPPSAFSGGSGIGEEAPFP